MGKSKMLEYDFDSIIGGNEQLLKVKHRAQKASATDSPVLIYGETGTGKEVFIQAIHNNSKRRGRAFVAENCAAIPENLLEGILFGTVRGSFTGAENRKGLFQAANGGSLYLDELNSMPIELQVKLLRAIQEGVITPVGDTSSVKVDVRIMASLNEEPEKLIAEGRLRRDLYYRLNVMRINIMPLRERKEDIPALVSEFISFYNESFKANIEGVDKSVMTYLISREWRGNIRELRHFIEGIFNIKTEGRITIEDVEELVAENLEVKFMPLKEKLELEEKRYIKEALMLEAYNVTKAAKLLGMPRQTLQYRMKRLGIE